MDFATAAHELYGVAPDAFVETRTRLVREARAGGDAALAKRLGALRRPTVSAWAVNLLGRSAGEELGWLLETGERLREAWASGGGLGGLEQRRGEVVRLLVRRARELAAEAGHPLREPAVREVEDTLQAATVDGDVAEEVRRGRLTQPRSHAGFVLAGFPPAPDEAAEQPPGQPSEQQPGEQASDHAGRAGTPQRRTAAKSEARGGRTAGTQAGKAEAGRAKPDKAKAERRKRTERRERAEAEKVRAEREKAHRAALRRAEEAERALADREADLAEARRDLASADADVGRLRRELDRAVARRRSAARRAEKAERLREKAAQAAGEARRRAREASPAG